jgi:hypothetical protein
MQINQAAFRCASQAQKKISTKCLCFGSNRSISTQSLRLAEIAVVRQCHKRSAVAAVVAAVTLTCAVALPLPPAAAGAQLVSTPAAFAAKCAGAWRVL